MSAMFTAVNDGFIKIQMWLLYQLYNKKIHRLSSYQDSCIPHIKNRGEKSLTSQDLTELTNCVKQLEAQYIPCGWAYFSRFLTQGAQM